jgi:rRNA maturation endonuclease Nob1
MSIFWSVLSAISGATLNVKTRCPKCGGKMKRETMYEEEYTRTQKPSSTFMSRSVTPRTAMMGASAFPKVRATPVYDVCTICGHRVRRKDMKSPV